MRCKGWSCSPGALRPEGGRAHRCLLQMVSVEAPLTSTGRSWVYLFSDLTQPWRLGEHLALVLAVFYDIRTVNYSETRGAFQVFCGQSEACLPGGYSLGPSPPGDSAQWPKNSGHLPFLHRLFSMAMSECRYVLCDLEGHLFPNAVRGAHVCEVGCVCVCTVCACTHVHVHADIHIQQRPSHSQYPV